jgi:hypothetical protein
MYSRSSNGKALNSRLQSRAHLLQEPAFGPMRAPKCTPSGAAEPVRTVPGSPLGSASSPPDGPARPDSLYGGR